MCQALLPPKCGYCKGKTSHRLCKSCQCRFICIKKSHIFKTHVMRWRAQSTPSVSSMCKSRVEVEFVVSALCGDTEARVGAMQTRGKGERQKWRWGRKLPLPGALSSRGLQDSSLSPSQDLATNTDRHSELLKGIEEQGCASDTLWQVLCLGFATKGSLGDQREPLWKEGDPG